MSALPNKKGAIARAPNRGASLRNLDDCDRPYVSI